MTGPHRWIAGEPASKPSLGERGELARHQLPQPRQRHCLEERGGARLAGLLPGLRLEHLEAARLVAAGGAVGLEGEQVRAEHAREPARGVARAGLAARAAGGAQRRDHGVRLAALRPGALQLEAEGPAPRRRETHRDERRHRRLSPERRHPGAEAVAQHAAGVEQAAREAELEQHRRGRLRAQLLAQLRVQRADEAGLGQEAGLVEQAAFEVDAHCLEPRAGVHRQTSRNA
jgi:hypothetical protein